MAAAALTLLPGCSKSESSSSSSKEPYFKIVVRNDETVPLGETEDMSAWYSMTIGSSAWSGAKNTGTHTEKAIRFWVDSNLPWKVVSATGEDEDWIYPFPSSGEKEGLFFFKTQRNIDPINDRTALFNVMVDKGNGFEAIEGIISVTQEKSARFLEMNAAKFSADASGQNLTLRVTANVDWDYTLTPSATYATADTEWITDNSEHSPGKQIDTLRFSVAPNDLGVRGAEITVNYTLDGESYSDVIPITQYPATESDLDGFPVKWVVRMADNTYAGTWPSSGTIPPVSGEGLISFRNVSGMATLDVSGDSPRVTKAQPGDYMEMVAASPVSAGTIVKAVFATRSSGGGPKYWRLEFRDGEEWKVVSPSFTDPNVVDAAGQPIVYTHAMNADGATNTLVESLVTYSTSTDQVEFRFICASNLRASGAGTISETGTWRLSVDEATAEDPYQPQISIVAAGPGTLVKANMKVSPSYLTFDGSNSLSRKFSVTCDQDFTITPSENWIHVDASASGSGEDLPFTVTCDDNTSASTREGVVTVKAGITRADINIIQGGKGGADLPDLGDFIGISSGNHVAVDSEAGSTAVTVVANTTVIATVSDSWLSVTEGSTKASSITNKKYIVSFTRNTDLYAERVGYVYFRNTSGSLESVLTVTQEQGVERDPISFPVKWTFPDPSDKWVEGTDYSLPKNGSTAAAFIYSDDHTGKISVVRAAGSNGQARGNTSYNIQTGVTMPDGNMSNERMFLYYGMGPGSDDSNVTPGSYWEFEIGDVRNPAGTYNISYMMCSSGGGPKYFRLEYTLENNWDNPVAIEATNTAEYEYGKTGNPVSYTYATPSNNKAVEVDASFHLGAMDKNKTLRIRAIVASRINCKVDNNVAVNTTATNRIFGTPTVAFTAD